MSRVTSAITFALLIFMILFISAWYFYMHLRQDRIQLQPSRQNEVEIMELDNGEKFMNIHQPFRPREYIRINKSEKDV